jgi:predicted phage-related endonuclease
VREIERDDELIGHLATIEAAFWRDHVVAGVQPPPDGSEACTTLLADLYPPAGRSTVTVDESEVDVIDGLRAAKAEAAADVKEAEDRKRAAENALRARLGDATDLVAPDGRTLATWRPQTKRTLDVGFDRDALAHAHPTIARLLTRETTFRVLRTPKGSPK